MFIVLKADPIFPTAHLTGNELFPYEWVCNVAACLSLNWCVFKADY